MHVVIRNHSKCYANKRIWKFQFSNTNLLLIAICSLYHCNSILLSISMNAISSFILFKRKRIHVNGRSYFIECANKCNIVQNGVSDMDQHVLFSQLIHSCSEIYFHFRVHSLHFISFPSTCWFDT